MNTTYRPWRIVHSECSLGWGGQEHRVLAELEGFKRRGCAVWLLAPQEAEVFKRARAAGIPTQPLNVARLLYPLNALKLASWLRRNRVQIVNTHSSRDGWLVGVAARLARLPLVIRTRHIDVDYPNRWLSRHAFTTLADHVLTTSARITAHLQEMFALPDERISTVPTGIDLGCFQPDGPCAELVPRLAQKSTPLIGMISVLRSWKGHPVFLNAAKQLVDAGLKAHFVIVGAGPIRQRIEQQIAALGLGEVVTLTGHREDVPEALRALSVLVAPSTAHEGVPQIGLQALACKTPVVGSDVGGIPEIIRHGETGRIFPSGDAGKLAACIRDAMTQTEATAAMTVRGRELVEANHSLDGMVQTLDTLYRRKLGA